VFLLKEWGLKFSFVGNIYQNNWIILEIIFKCKNYLCTRTLNGCKIDKREKYIGGKHTNDRL
jgi:hypothetical protein